MANYLEFEKAGMVSIWVGEFSSQNEFNDYLQETIDGDAEVDVPINRFAHDIGVGFYDHDSQEAEYKHEHLPVKDLLAGFWRANSYSESAAAAAELIGVERANTAVLLFDWKYRESTKRISNSPLRFLGSFGFGDK